jgi:hypothetical protein
MRLKMDGLTHAAIMLYTVGALGIAFGIWCLKTQKAEEKASQNTADAE